MRFFGFLLAALLFTGLPLINNQAQAQQNSQGGAVFGTANCSQQFRCPDEATFSFPVVNNNANICVAQFFGYNNPNGMFDDAAGLDGDNCLTSKPNSIPKGAGAQLAPHCCLVKQPTGFCSLHCDIIAQ
jgi:hypothetical protein